MDAAKVPFTTTEELISKLANCDIPPDTVTRLRGELSCPVLEELYPLLDFVGRRSSLNIDPIHKHLQKGRKIVLTEDPSLHLVWFSDTVYIKPLPHYLLSHSFWKKNLGQGQPHRGEALGFVRSYGRLIQYPSDFELAKEAKLIPSSSPNEYTEGLTYTVFAAFIRSFSKISDAEVSRRWNFGQLRLSRLHWAVRILQPRSATTKGFLHRLFYEEQFWHTGQFLNEFAAPLLFVFAALSLILSAMQVVLAAKSDDEGSWRVFEEVSAWFAVVAIIVLVVVFVGLGAIVVGIWVLQFHFGYRSWKRTRGQEVEEVQH
ncbi:hypothetical protein AYO21_04052 [Fonsecaea monophora]|uniref:Uncharacterized protein n=1 Tax=Fonsecaea monophora TaxID=254056 RepID=A0A177FC65_9EURO|nr:hypothetical protein AYO21_04052 [Fonsecaea monophora]KAH0826841.1 hypothetical protein FOPE_00008 [Fonsecaea pedrosoi]OAG41817.1 hypothetical protein AYO21_04052 [Fonsecaea monophora]